MKWKIDCCVLNYQLASFVLLELSIFEFIRIVLFSRSKTLVLFSLIMKPFDTVFFVGK